MAPLAMPPLLRRPWTKELATLHTPEAISSCVASVGLPSAKRKKPNGENITIQSNEIRKQNNMFFPKE